MGQWNLTSAEVAYVLAKEGIEPEPGSPFMRLNRSDEESKPPSARDWPSLLESISVIAKPGSVLGLVHYPPDDPQYSLFYGNSSHENLALHKKKFDGTEHVIVWPLHPRDVYEDFLWPLDLAMPADPKGELLHLDRDSLVTLAAIVDILQEDSLIAFLNRSAVPKSSFNASELLACFYRSLQDGDFRWMAQRARLVSPVSLAPVSEDIERGLSSLERMKLIQREDDRFGLSTALAVIGARLSDCSGLAALSAKKKPSKSSQAKMWNRRHIAAARGLNSLWFFEFSQISKEDYRLELSDMGPAELQKRLHSFLYAEDRKDLPSRPPVPSSPSHPPGIDREVRGDSRQGEEKILKFCSQCGGDLRAGASFCSQCGYRLIPKESKR
jgi:hypothetical protein